MSLLGVDVELLWELRSDLLFVTSTMAGDGSVAAAPVIVDWVRDECKGRARFVEAGKGSSAAARLPETGGMDKVSVLSPRCDGGMMMAASRGDLCV